MTQLRLLVAAATAAVVLVATSSAAQQHDQHRHHGNWGPGQEVALTACVEKGMKDDTYILTHVADVPVHPPMMGRVVYWLDKTKDLKKHVGHQIRVTGKIDEVKQSEMEVKAGEAEDGGWYVEIEGPGKDVRTPAANVGVSPSGRRDEGGDIKIMLVKLKVDEVTMVANSCRVPQ
jgi:hypothetical protein